MMEVYAILQVYSEGYNMPSATILSIYSDYQTALSEFRKIYLDIYSSPSFKDEVEYYDDLDFNDDNDIYFSMTFRNDEYVNYKLEKLVVKE